MEQEWDHVAQEFRPRAAPGDGEEDAPAVLPEQPGPRLPLSSFLNEDGEAVFPDAWRFGDPEPELTREEEDELVRVAEGLKAEGNTSYRDGNMEDAISKYSRAVSRCPPTRRERSVYFGNRAAALMAKGDHQGAIQDCSYALAVDSGYVRALARRASCYEHLGEESRALEDWKRVADLDVGNRDARAAIIRLEPRVSAQEEKLKAEMMEKLKDLGNTILGRFGLSLDNFKLQPNPNGEGYSVLFSQGQNGS